MDIAEEELGRWIDAHAAALELFARQWTEASADVVQEAFLALVRTPKRPDDVPAWLFRTVRNGAISAARAAARRRRHETAASRDNDSWFVPHPEMQIDARTATESLKHLPDDPREVVIAHLWGGLTFDQIGQVVGVSSSTAHRRYLAGLNILRERLGETCPEK